MTDVSPESRFAGVLKIVRFNIQFYVISVVATALLAATLSFHRLPRWLAPGVFAALIATAFWTVSSLLVSWFVYDFAGVTRWAWMRTELRTVPQRWVNIHAGLDESTSALKTLFPGSQGAVIDIYDPAEMTEPSIARARRLCPASEPFVGGKTDSLPLPDADRDGAFLLFAAHEVRAPGRRTQLLCETNRILTSGGNIVLVEHLRDWPNFLAFGPGFLHFHSERSWRSNIRMAGLEVEHESTITPFVHCFLLRKAKKVNE